MSNLDQVGYRFQARIINIDVYEAVLQCYIPAINKLVKVSPIKREWEEFCTCQTLTTQMIHIKWNSENSDILLQLFDSVQIVLAPFPHKSWNQKLIIGLSTNEE